MSKSRLDEPEYLAVAEAWLAAFGQIAGEEVSGRVIVEIVGRLADLLPDALWFRTPDFRLLFMNRAFEEIWGRTRREAYRDSSILMGSVHPDDLAMVEAAGRQPGDVNYPDHRIVRPDGTVRWVRVRTSCRQVSPDRTAITIGTAEDITDYHQTLDRLRQREADYRLLVENQDQLVVKVDMENRFLYVSPSYCELFQKSEQELLGQVFVPLVHESDRASTLKAMETLAQPPHTCYLEQRAMTRHGWRWLSWMDKGVLDADGKVVGIIGVGKDITERRLARDELARAVVREQRANREKDAFLAMLSHELRTPLTPVLASVSALAEDTRLDPEVRDDLVMIKRNIELESRLIDDLLDLTRISRGKLRLDPRVVDAHDLLRRALDISATDIEQKNLEVTSEFGATQSRILADPARVQQVFWNVIKNAVQFTDDGGRIDIVTSNQQDQMLVRISDSGAGIDRAFLKRIFNAFEQGPRPGRQGSLGLGLAISRMVLDLHGGSITAESDGPGKGSCFTIRVPLSTEAPPPERASVQGSGGGPSLRILLVEDHANTLQVLSKLLRRMGHDVLEANTLAKARALASGEFDLLISDVGLPDGSGLELMKSLPKRSRLRAIALSGYGMDADISRSRAAGFHAHLTKPVDMQRLGDTIREVMADQS